MVKHLKTLAYILILSDLHPDRIGLNYSAIVFSESVERIPLKDPIYSLSTTVYFNDKYPNTEVQPQITIRILFQGWRIKGRADIQT